VARGRLDEAEGALRRALELAPAHAEALNTLGYCLSLPTQGRAADREAELNCYLKAWEADPTLPDVARNLAQFFGSADGKLRPEEAIRWWKEFARLSPPGGDAQAEAAAGIAAMRKLILDGVR
jgi:tetratricopeptide (TPR) repeat protein